MRKRRILAYLADIRDDKVYEDYNQKILKKSEIAEIYYISPQQVDNIVERKDLEMRAKVYVKYNAKKYNIEVN